MKVLLFTSFMLVMALVCFGIHTEYVPSVITRVTEVNVGVPVTNGWIIAYNDEGDETNRYPVVHFEVRRVPKYISITNMIPIIVED
jgi:hypothetical protein